MVALRIGKVVFVPTLVLAVLLATTSIAHAGGSWFSPAKDRYEPGESVTMVGYTGGGAYGWIEDGPFFGTLREADKDGTPIPDGVTVAVGQLTLTETGRGGYLTLRASITFELPPDQPPGTYFFDYCNEQCDQRLGDLIGGYVYIGVDPTYPISREWPLDDPEIANLDSDAALSGPGFELSAEQLQTGEIEVGADGLPLRTAPTPAPTTTLPVSTSTTPAQSTAVPAISETATPAPIEASATPAEGRNWRPWGIAAATALAAAFVIFQLRSASTVGVDKPDASTGKDLSASDF